MKRDRRTNTYTGYTKEAVVAKFEDVYYTNDNPGETHVVRWFSNDTIPNPDMLTDWQENGLLSSAELDLSIEVRSKELSAFLNDYMEAQANRSPEQIAEEQMMARDAFGPDVEVVNVVTGETF